MRVMTKLFVALAMTVMVLPPAVAQQRLRPIGTAEYNPRPADMLSYKMDVTPDNRFLSKLQVIADKGSGEVRDFIITYRDGEGERFHLHQKLREDDTSDVVRVNPDRPVQSIEMTYIPDGAVRFVILADPQPPAPPPPPPPPPPAAWLELGCKSVGFLIDKDIVDVGTRDTFQAVRLRSTGFDIEMIEMAIRFQNGERDVYRINQVIPSGGRTSPIALRGNQRRIASVEFTYRTRTLSNQRTQLCIDGLKAAPQ